MVEHEGPRKNCENSEKRRWNTIQELTRPTRRRRTIHLSPQIGYPQPTLTAVKGNRDAQTIQYLIFLQATTGRATGQAQRFLRTLWRRNRTSEEWQAVSFHSPANDRKRCRSPPYPAGNRSKLPHQWQRLSHTNGDRGTLRGRRGQSRCQARSTIRWVSSVQHKPDYDWPGSTRQVALAKRRRKTNSRFEKRNLEHSQSAGSHAHLKGRWRQGSPGQNPAQLDGYDGNSRANGRLSRCHGCQRCKHNG